MKRAGVLWLLLPLLGCLTGCITQTQEFSDCRVILQPGKNQALPYAVVLGAQVAAKPVGVEALNPLLSAAPNVNSPNSTARSGDLTQEKLPVVQEKRETVVDVVPDKVLGKGVPEPKAEPNAPAKAPAPPGPGANAVVPKEGEEHAAGTAGGG